MSAPENRLRESICLVGRSLFERGYVHGAAGNISARTERGFLITPTDACLGRLDPNQLALVGHDGIQIAGDLASKTLQLHRRIYSADASTGSVLHTHSTHLVALTLRGVWQPQAVLPPITPYFVMKVGPIPLIPYAVPGDSLVADQVAMAISQRRLRGVLLERLGPVVWHDSPEKASVVLEELEETARLWLLNEGQVSPLDESQVQALCARFDAHWA